MFMRILGARQMMEKATAMAPAASRSRSTNAKHPISFLDTIVYASYVLGGGERGHYSSFRTHCEREWLVNDRIGSPRED